MNIKNEKEITIVKAKSTKALNEAVDLIIETDEDYQNAGNLKLRIKEISKTIEERKSSIIKPINEALAQIRSMFRPAEESCKTSDSIVTSKMIAYDDKKELEAKKKAESIESKVESGYIKPETAVKQLENIDNAPKGMKSVLGTVFIRKTKNVRIINESLIPREYLMIDMVKLRQAMLKDGKKVPGAEVFEEKNMGGRKS